MNEAQRVFAYDTYQLLQGIAQAPKNEPVSPTTSNNLFGNPIPERSQLKLSQHIPYLWSSLNCGLSRLSKLLAVASAWEEPLVCTCFCFSDEASDGD